MFFLTAILDFVVERYWARAKNGRQGGGGAERKTACPKIPPPSLPFFARAQYRSTTKSKIAGRKKHSTACEQASGKIISVAWTYCYFIYFFAGTNKQTSSVYYQFNFGDGIFTTGSKSAKITAYISCTSNQRNYFCIDYFPALRPSLLRHIDNVKILKTSNSYLRLQKVNETENELNGYAACCS